MPAGQSALAAVREEAMVAGGTQLEVVDLCDRYSTVRKRRGDRGLEVEPGTALALHRDLRAEAAAKLIRERVAHLVAAGANRRPDRRAKIFGARAGLRERFDRHPGDLAESPPPTGVDRCDPGAHG